MERRMEMEEMLTAKQVAEVKGCSYQYVKRIIKEGKLPAIKVLNSRNRKKYLIPLEALDEELQKKWYQMEGRTADMQEAKCDYEALIRGEIQPRTAEEKLIAVFTRTDAGLVLAVIGMDHPASQAVFRHLAAEKIEKTKEGIWMSRQIAPHNDNEYLKRRDALRQAVMETMDIMLNSGLFTSAAKRSLEDYRSIVFSNLITMADSIAGRYERILGKVGD